MRVLHLSSLAILAVVLIVSITHLGPDISSSNRFLVHAEAFGQLQGNNVQNNYKLPTSQAENDTGRYQFDLWPENSEMYPGYAEEIFSKICPIPQAQGGLDNSTGKKFDSRYPLEIDVYFTAPNGTTLAPGIENLPSGPDCNKMRSQWGVFPDKLGTWSVFETAIWMENSTVHQIRSKTVTFDVKEPPFSGKVTRIISLTDFKNEIKNQLNLTKPSQEISRLQSIRWSQDGKEIIIKTQNDFAGPDLWAMRTDGTGLHSISTNDTLMENISSTPNQLGDMVVSIPTSVGPSVGGPNTDIVLENKDRTYQQLLYRDNTTPELPAISPDGHFVAFASEAFYGNSYDKPDEDGIYLITLSTPIPEFPFAVPILVAGIASLIVFRRLKIQK